MARFSFSPSSLLLLVISLSWLASLSTGKESSILPLARASPVSTAPSFNRPAVARRPSATHHAAPAALAKARRHGHVPPSTPLTLTLQLHPRSSMEAVHSKRSDEGRILEDTLREHVKPKNEALEDMLRWLNANGIRPSTLTTSKLGDKVNVPTTVGVAERMLDTTVSRWEVDGKLHLRSPRYTIPSEVGHVIRSISPLLDFAPGPTPRPRLDPADILQEQTTVERRFLNIPGVLQGLLSSIFTLIQSGLGALSITVAQSIAPPALSPGRSSYATACPLTGFQSPACIRDYYGIDDSGSATPSGGIDFAIAAIGDVDESYSPGDLKDFISSFATYASSYKEPVVRGFDGFVNRPNEANATGSETMMDIEAAVSLAYPLQTAVIGSRNGSISQYNGDLYSSIFQHLIDDFDANSRPKVISISYAGDENDYTQEQGRAMCDTAAQLVALGTTIVMGSGDEGLANYDKQCPNGKLSPTWPSTCPYILSTGSVTGFNQDEHIVSPADFLGFASGSSYSNFFSFPAYQSAVRQPYLATLGAAQTARFNTNGRSVPDVTTLGLGMPYIYRGALSYGRGTSLSAPIMGAMIAKINAARRAKGQNSVGHVQPAFYSNLGAFNDVTKGAVGGCSNIPDASFPATVGFDAASGIGSPRMAGLRRIFGVA